MGPTRVSLCGLWTCVPVCVFLYMWNGDLWVLYASSYKECGLVGPIVCSYVECGLVGPVYMCSYVECGLVGPVCVLLCGAGTCGSYECSSVECGA